MKLCVFCASTGNHNAAVETWVRHMNPHNRIYIDNATEGNDAGYLTKLEKAWKQTEGDVIAHLHSDIFIHAPNWDKAVLMEFEDPGVVVASFFGAKTLGRPELYRAPYDHRQLARGDCISNMVDAHVHGRRVLEPTDVAMIDSFSCIVRKSFLDEIGGWKVSGLLESHCSDMWICLMAHRHKKRVRYIPVNCTHLSGGVRGDGSFSYPDWQRWYGHTDAEMHAYNHQLIYKEFRDVLPVRIP